MNRSQEIDPKARVAVLLGGMSPERTVSLKSGHSVAGALRERGWDVVEIDVGPDLPARLVAERIDVAWIALHGNFGEDGCVQGLLEVMRIPYTGSGPRASALSMDKIATKNMLRDSGLYLAPHRVLLPGDEAPRDLEYPIVIKAPNGGSTIGVVICQGPESLANAIAECRVLSDQVFLEQYVAGDEITVAVLDGQALPVVGIVPESGFFDFEAKYTKGRTRYDVPARIAESTARTAQEHALIAARILGLCGVARADFIVDAGGRPWFLEVNTIPGMTATSLSPMAAGAVGISFGDLVERVLLKARLHLEVAP